MEQELARHTRGLRQPGEPPPFFLSYLLHANEGLSVWGRYGSVFRSEPQRDADLYAEIRVGSHRLDNMIDGGITGDLTQRQSFNWIEGPEDYDPDVIRYALWRLTQHKYDESLQEFYEKKKILVEQQLPPGKSFSAEPVLTHFDDVKPVVFPKKRWEAFVRDTSMLYRKYRFMLDPYVQIRGMNKVRIFVNSEGSRFICQDTYYEVSLQSFLLGPDGVHLESTRTFYGREPSDLPTRAQVSAAIDAMAKELKELAQAKPLDPYAGPALLSGYASGLIFHEAIGHRLEGERMGSRSEGHTFASKIGQRILPVGVDIVDDPTLRSIEGVPLHGHYTIDDEAVRAQRTELVEDGVLKSFLSSRQLVEGGGKQSNGHGRHERFQDPMARMANLVVRARNGKTWDELKAQLCEETARRGLPYGLIIRGVSAGETRTDQYDFQAFKGVPTAVYTVDPKTGKETRVRDVTFIGTPLAVIQRILGFGDSSEVDNSYCFAESGAVPVATVAPAMLVGELELQRASTRRYRPARLPLPPMRETTRR
jgi:TldD protein